MITLRECSPSWDNWVADQIRDQEIEHAEDEIARDLEREADLAREFATGQIEAWPWYADAPVEICEPEAIP